MLITLGGLIMAAAAAFMLAVSGPVARSLGNAIGAGELALLFGLYVANFATYNKTYGTLAGVIVFLLWLWITNLALLFGAELDAELERGRELRAGMAAEEELQLPPRDTRGLRKDAATRRRFVDEARALRRPHGHAR